MNMCPQVNLALRRRDLAGEWRSGIGDRGVGVQEQGAGPTGNKRRDFSLKY